MSSSDGIPVPGPWLALTGRPYWLPPTGRGNGLAARSWSPIARIPQAMADPLLRSLAASAIPGWAAPVSPFHDGGPDDPDAPYDLWIDTAHFDSGEETVMRYLAALRDAERREAERAVLSRPAARRLTRRRRGGPGGTASAPPPDRRAG